MILFQLRHLEVDRVKEDLVEVYEKWDGISITVAKKVVIAEESITKIKNVETYLGGVSKFLMEESKILVENIHDSGISDVGDNKLSNNIKKQEEKLKTINKTIDDVQESFPSKSLNFGQVLSVLKESNSQLKFLKSIAKKKQSKPSSSTDQYKLKDSQKSFCSKFMKYWKIMTFFLCMMMMISMLLTPNCCEHSNSWYLLLPSITYTSGPRPF